MDSRYGVKYPFPHSVVHIIDNSMFTGELPVVIADDPSLNSTIVVCGAPMGESNKMIPLNRSDVANVAFGLGNLDASTIERYGQAITYPASLIAQNAPVKFMRVTPDDATYGAAIIVIQWREDPDDNKIHVRFKNAEWPASISRSRFKNTARVNDALVSALKSDSIYEDGYTWKQRVLIDVIPAGKGSVYNNMSFAVNMSSQSKKPANVRYIFSTIDSRTSQVIERFDGSLVNINNNDRTDYIPTVNQVVNQRVQGSSVLVPYVNEKAVQELYKTYITHLKNQNAMGYGNDYTSRVEASVNVNTFDVIYGNYIYNGTDSAVKLPFYQVDSIDTSIVKLDVDHILDSGIVDGTDYGQSMFQQKIIDMTTGIVTEKDAVHVGDLYLTAQSGDNAKISIVASINQYTGAVTAITIPKLYALNNSSELNFEESGEIVYRIPGLITEFGNALAVTLTTADISINYPGLYTQINIGTVVEGSIIAGATDTTFEVYYVEKLTNVNGNITLKLKKYTNEQIYFGLDRNSHKNLVKGTGNVMAWDYTVEEATAITGNGEYVDYVMGLPGYTVIRHAPDGATDLNAVIVVNSYDSGDSVEVAGAALKVGEVPQSVKLNNDAVGEKYDVRSFESSNVDTFLINGIEIANATGANKCAYAVGDKVSVVIDESDEPKTTLVDMVVETTTVEPITTKFYQYDESAAGHKGAEITAFDTSTVYCDKTNESTPVYYVAIDTAATYDSLNAVSVTAHEYTDGTETKTEYIVTNQHLVLTVTGVDADGNITDYKIYRSASIKNADTQFNDVVGGQSFKIKKITYVPEEESYTNLTSTEAPSDWGTAANKYYTIANHEVVSFTNTGTEADPVYAPAYEANVYCIKNSFSDDSYATATSKSIKVLTATGSPYAIKRYIVSGSLGSLFRISPDSAEIPANYYNEEEYGILLNSEAGGVPITGGYTGFFDDENMNPIVFKWKYAALLTRAFKGELDKTIMSPTRCPAKYLFDAAYNTIVGSNIVPELRYTPEELINASTVFTEDEKEEILFDKSLLDGIGSEPDDIDVKAAMYELMDIRVFQGIPEDFRPVGQGSGLSLHLDSGVVDDNTLQLVANSFAKRFSSYNASWDIGGYQDPTTGLKFTYTKWIVDHLFTHMAQYTVNKPFANKYGVIPPSSYISYFPDIDTIDWDKRSAAYKAGGNSWIVDPNGNLIRQSQRTLYRVADTSDLIQENNARTLSQLVYLLQNKINTYILEYSDDDTLKTMTDDCNIMFQNWVGSRVDALDISFERDINPEDGGDVVVCYCAVTFRGLILRVPIIVDVRRRQS